MFATCKSFRRSTKVRYGLLSAAVLVAMSQFASAGTFTWNQPAGGAWTTGANWTGGLPTNLPGDTINLNNNITGAAAITLSANQTMGIMNIGDSASSFFAFTVGANGGSNLIFNNSGANAQLNKTGTGTTAVDVIAAPVVIAGTAGLAISNSSDSNLSITGGITSTGTNSNLVFNQNGAGTIAFSTGAVNISGTITNSGTGTVSGTYGLILAAVGSNVTAINENSTFNALNIAGTLTVNTNGTTLSIGAGGKNFAITAVNGTGNIITSNNSAGTLTLGGNLNNTGNIINNGTGVGTTIAQGGMGSNVTGFIQNSATSSLQYGSGNNFVVNGGGTTITDNGGGTIIFNGAVTGSGGLILNNNSTLAAAITIGAATVNNSGTITNSGTGIGSSTITKIIGTNVLGVIQNSLTSSLVLTGVDTYTHATTVNAGTLLVSTGGSLSSSNPLTFTGTGTFNANESATSFSQGMGLLTLTAGEATIQSTFGTSATLTFAGLAARPAGATANFVTSGGANGTTNSIILTGKTAGFIDQGTFFGGTNYAWMNATGTFVRGINYASDTGAFTTAVTSSISDSAGIGGTTTYVQTTGAVSAQATNAGWSTLNISGANNFTLANTNSTVLTVNGILKSGGNAAVLAPGSGTGEGIQAASNAELVIRTDAAADKLTISANILANGINAFTKSGLGTLVLSGANSYSGATTINAGTLQFAQETALYNNTPASWTASNIVVNDSATLALNVGGAGFTASDVTTLVGMTSTPTTGFVNGSSLGLDTTNAGGTFTYGTALTNTNSGNNSLGLTKLGTGTLVITGANTYTGATLVNAGTLQLAASTSISSGDNLTVLSSATFDLNGNSQTLGLVNNAGTVTNSSSSTVNLTIGDGSTDTGSFTGKLNITWNQAAVANTTAVAFNNAGTLTLNANGVGTITDSGGIGSNVTNLSLNANGTATITLSGATAVNNTGTITNAGIGTGTATISSVIGTHVTGVTQNSVTSTLVLSGANTYTGAIDVNNGTLKAGVASVANVSGAFGNNSAVTLANTAGAILSLVTFNTQIGSLTGGGANGGNVSLGTATLTVGGDNTSPAAYAGVIFSGAGGGVTKIGSGTLTLSGVNTYTGATLVSAGKLTIASTGSINSTSGATINGSTANFNYNASTAYTQPLSFGASGGTLSGAGTISASGGVSAGTNAIIAPGNSPGILTFTSGLTFASGGTYLWTNNGGNSNSQVAGTDFSQIAVSAGTVTINSGANLSLSFNATTNFTNAFWTSTETFDLIHNSGSGSLSGSFANNKITISGTSGSLTNAANSLSQGTFSTAITGGDMFLTWTPTITTTATTYTLSAGAGSLNVLLNGTTSASASITNSGTGTADMLNFTGLVSASGAGGIITGTASSGGPLNQTVSSSNTSLTFQGTAYGSATLTPSVTTAANATIPGNATNNGITTAAVNVGEANADNSNSQSSFTGTVLTGTVAASGSYAGLASRVFTATAGTGGAGTLNSEATLMAGTSTNGNTVSMTWRTRITGEVFPNATDPSIPYTAPHGLVSDVVRLTGMNLAGGQTRGATVQTDDFVLQMTYSGISGAQEANLAAQGGIYLAYLDPADTQWTNAVLGNFTVDGNTGQYAMTDFLGSYSAFVADENTAHPGWTLNDVLGSWGVDTAAATDSTGATIDGDVWAVLNHNSDFAVLVPEPASLTLLGLGAVGLLARRRRR